MNEPNLKTPLTQMQDLTNNQHSHFITEIALTSCGFEQATRSTTPREIWNIHPHGGTAMRDALLYGNDLMLKLHDLLQRQSTSTNWNFLHILITDGHDTDSNASYQRTYQALSTLRADMNVRDLKVIILGVDIEYGYASQLRNLVAAAGIHGEYHDITHTDIKRIFHRIRTDFGMTNRPVNQNIQAMNQIANGKVGSQPAMEYYAVLFTLDISGSMHGHKWDVTRHAVVDFIRYLGPYDIVSAIVFNDYPHLVMHWNTRQNQMQMGRMTKTMPYAQIMSTQGYYDPNEFRANEPYLNNQRQYQVRDPYEDECCTCQLI